MPAEFQKAMDHTLIGLQNTFCFFDGSIIITTGSESKHKDYVIKCLKKIEIDNLLISLEKCYFAKSEIEWLGKKINQTGILSIESKTAALFVISLPNTLKRLRSFLCSVHHIIKLIATLEQIPQLVGIQLQYFSGSLCTAEVRNNAKDWKLLGFALSID